MAWNKQNNIGLDLYYYYLAGVVGAGMGIATLGYILTKFADRQAEAARLEKLKKKKLLKEEARQSGAADMEVIY